jgi:hypothetical protein
VPEPDEQLSVLAALVAASPATAEIETILLGGNINVHCAAAGSLPGGDVKVRFRGIVPSAAVVPEDKTNESVCPKEVWAATKTTKSGARDGQPGSDRGTRCPAGPASYGPVV